jgi:histidine triad (HIT) family protein
MASIFTKIINEEIPCYKVAENEYFIAFLDVFPLVKGHVLVVSKLEIDYMFDMETEHLMAFMAFAQGVAKAMKTVIDCKKIGVTVIGLEVPHAHIHLVPINLVVDMNFANSKLSLDKEVMNAMAMEISNAYTTLNK